MSDTASASGLMVGTRGLSIPTKGPPPLSPLGALSASSSLATHHHGQLLQSQSTPATPTRGKGDILVRMLPHTPMGSFSAPASPKASPKSPLAAIAPHGTALLPTIPPRRVSSVQSPAAVPPSSHSVPSSSMSDGKRAKLLHALLVERGKDTLLSKLKRKYILPDMPKELQDSIEVLIDELSALPTVHMTDLEKMTKKIGRLKKEFYEKVTNIEYQYDGPNQSKLEFPPPISPTKLAVMNPEFSGDQTGNYETSFRDDHSNTDRHSSALPANQGQIDEWNALVAANLQLEIMDIMRTRERQKEEQLAMRRILEQQVDEKKKKSLEDREKDLQYQREILEISAMKKAQLEADQNVMIQQRLMERDARQRELDDAIAYKKYLRQFENERDQEYLSQIQEELEYEHQQHLEEARKKHEELHKVMQLSEERRSQKREVIMRHLEKEREDLRRMNEIYDQKKAQLEDQQSKLKLQRSSHQEQKVPLQKSLGEKSYEDELRAQRELQEYEERLKEAELHRLRSILQYREEAARSVEVLHAEKEIRRRREKEENEKQIQNWKAEAELQRKEQMQRQAHASQQNRQYAHDLQEQMRLKEHQKRVERLTMSDTERRMNRSLLELSGIGSLTSSRS